MQCYPHSYGLELSAIRAAAARHDLEALNLIPEALVVSGIDQEDQPLLANVGVRVLAIFAGAEYARLFSVHNDLQVCVCVGRVPGAPTRPPRRHRRRQRLYIQRAGELRRPIRALYALEVRPV